ncbi:hypothetical protein DXG03_009664 [Asterophora parasitica]|uniref:Uncharacterized protein n=1 Tax=Asterophora parasitica TaxID=117018 RepID=A0A9P7KCE4_9AGAR|nr:hypothetical protein DXG03_009664 [Asterophora parasitica]
MRAPHTPHALPAFPVYSSSFLSETKLVLGGGGGASRSGIKNKLRLYNVASDRSLQLLDEFELERGEDAPMSMAAHAETSTIICGVNSELEKLEKDQNENCRVFAVKDQKLGLLSTQGTLPPGDLDDYQLSLLSYPSLSPVAEPIHTEKEIYDASFSGTTLVVATTHNLLVYALPTPAAIPETPSPTKKGKGKARKAKSANASAASKLELLHTIDVLASAGGANGGTFRAAKYNPIDDGNFYTVVNTTPSRKPKAKATPRQAFVSKWNTKTWTVEKTRNFNDRGLTCFDISADGKFLGFGSSDLTIGLLDTNNLSPLVSILKAHDFPPTTIAFNTSSSLFVSGSPDNSVRVLGVPQSSGGGFSWAILLIIVALLVVLLAVLAQKYIATH